MNASVKPIRVSVSGSMRAHVHTHAHIHTCIHTNTIVYVNVLSRAYAGLLAFIVSQGK